MDTKKLEENLTKFLGNVLAEARKSVPTNPFKRIIVKPTMGPAIRLDVDASIEAVK